MNKQKKNYGENVYIITAAGGNATAIKVLMEKKSRSYYAARGSELINKYEAKEVEQAGFLILNQNYFDTVRQGMRDAVTVGTATSLNVPYVEVAAKTGTAQLGVAKNKVNSWVIGFFPYQDPKYAFAIMMEAGPNTNEVGASSIMGQLLSWMSVNTPEYFK